MAILCPSCGAENRDKARFCRGCARPLDKAGEGGDTADEARDRSRALRRARRRESATGTARRPAWSRWAGVLAAGAVALGLGWWLGAHQKTPAPAQAAALAMPAVGVPPAPAALTPATPPVPTETTLPAADAGAPAVGGSDPAAAVDRLRQSVELLEREDRARAAALAQRQKLAQERQRADEARRRTDALAAAAVHSPAPAAPAPPVAATAAPAPVAAPVATPTTVDQQCAASSNVFARDLCRLRECARPGRGNDPVCVRFRQMEEARRQEAENR